MSATSRISPRRYSRRNLARDSRKSAIDLNAPPPPPPPPPPTPVMIGAEEEGMASSSDPPIGDGASATPIDVEAIDEDDLQLLPSSRGFPQTRNQRRRRNRPVVVVVDEEQENHSQRTVTSHCLNRPRKRPRIQPKMIVINCESDSTSEDKRTSIPEPQKLVPKEPTFNCPICMSKLENPCSTICGHIFCENCLKTAVQVQKKCPTCRGKLTIKSFHRIFLPNADTD